MRRLLRSPFRIIALLGLLLTGAIAWHSLLARNAAQRYADDSLAAITQSWSAEALLARASPALRASNSPDHINQLFDWFGTLGALRHNHGCATQALSMGAATATGSAVLARFSCVADYINGTATIGLLVAQRGGVWMIDGFDVKSASLVQGRRIERI